MSLAETVCETKWIQKLLMELDIECKGPIQIFEDNQSYIKIAEGPHEHKRMKYINIKYNFLREAVTNNKVRIEYKASNEQVADIMTKRLGRNLFFKHRSNLNL